MMRAATTSEAPDLSTCDREAIHVPGSIQPHGLLLSLAEPDFTILQASKNVDSLLGRPLESVLGASLQEILGEQQGSSLAAAMRESSLDGDPVYVATIPMPGRDVYFRAIAHRFDGALILELECSDDRADASFHEIYPLIRGFGKRLKGALSVPELSQVTAEEVRRITGFDRVLIYKFDSSWHGHVIAESRSEALPSYLDLWFPASDIPQQARRLYEMNRVRLIADVDYVPVPLQPSLRPDTGQPLDLSFSALRSVSPVHIEYMRNMGTAASMSISILTEEGKLWGLISCHHRTARRPPIEVRTTCDFIAQTLSTQIVAREQREEYEARICLKSIASSLLAFMALDENFTDGLTKHPTELLEFARATGVAVLYEDSCTLLGDTPSEEEVLNLVDWLIERGREEIYATDCLPETYPQAERWVDRASGVLAISISKLYRSYILWFRPEVVQTVKWGGDPAKPVEPPAGGVRLHPRKSFETWKETVRGRSLPWKAAEVEAASDLRNSVIGIVLRKAEELAQLSSELQRSNKELASFSYSVSHDLRAPFRHIVGYSELLRQSPSAQLGEKDLRYLDTIMNAAHFAGTLVDNLLEFSQVGRMTLKSRTCDMDQIVREVQRELVMQASDRVIKWRLGNLPAVSGDLVMLRLVWQNLLQNAVKYTRERDEAVIEIGGEQQEGETLFYVRDNGVGFEQDYADRLFGVFQRLHRMEDYEGTGIGLANVRRIVDKHGGTTWAEGQPDRGATFYFTIPHRSGEGGGKIDAQTDSTR